jgi:hypothetical protein
MIQRHSQRVRKRLSDTLRPLRRSDPEVVRITASETSDQRNHCGGRDRQCGEPRLPSACLREVGDETDPTILLPFDGLKLSRLLSGLV